MLGFESAEMGEQIVSDDNQDFIATENKSAVMDTSAIHNSDCNSCNGSNFYAVPSNGNANLVKPLSSQDAFHREFSLALSMLNSQSENITGNKK